MEEFFYAHTGSCFQRVCGAVSFQAAVATTVTERTIWINTHVFYGSTVHEASLVNVMIHDNSTAKVTIQKKNNCIVEIKMIPEFQISRRFGIVFQMTWIWNSGSKIISF